MAKSKHKKNLAKQKEAELELHEETEVVLDQPAGKSGFNIPIPAALILLVSFLLYVQTVTYDYALDDKLVITHNTLTKKGFGGIGELMTTDFLVGFFGKQKNLLEGGRYRPLSLVMFAIEWELFGQSPSISHLVNALMYAFLCLLLYNLLAKLIPPRADRPWYFTVAFVGAMLFAIHPLHTEAIANIKGRDEILSLLLALGCLHFTLKWLTTKEGKHLAFSATCMFLGILAKETAITFMGVIPLAIHFFTKKSIKENVIACMPLVVVIIGYMALRIGVLGWRYDTTPTPEIMNNPFLYVEGNQELSTILFTMGLYIKLLFFPHPLTHDYYPWHPLGDFTYNHNVLVGAQDYPYIEFSDPRAFIPFLIYAGLLIYGIHGMIKTKSIPAFGVLFYLGTFFLVSNIPFPVGTLLNERFMFMPSIGFVMIVAHFFVNYLPRKFSDFEKYKKFAGPVLVAIALLLCIKTVTRNTVWEDDYHLSSTDVNVSYRSAKSNMSAGLAFVDHSKTFKTQAEKKPIIETAIKHLERSLEIYPKYIQPMLIMGNAYYEIEDYIHAVQYFERCLQLNPNYNYALQNLKHIGELCTNKKLFKEGAYSYTVLVKYQPKDVKILTRLGELYGKNLRDIPNSIKYLMQALKLKPKNSEVLQKLGVAYGMNGQPAEALKIFMRALELNPKNAHVLMNIGVTYNTMGQPDMGRTFLEQAFTIDPSLRAKMGGGSRPASAPKPVQKKQG